MNLELGLDKPLPVESSVCCTVGAGNINMLRVMQRDDGVLACKAKGSLTFCRGDLLL